MKANFQVEGTYTEFSTGHGRVEQRVVSICRTLEGICSWAGSCTLIRVSATRDVTPAEDASRIRVLPLPQRWTITGNLVLNLYRDPGFDNMAQAQRRCGSA